MNGWHHSEFQSGEFIEQSFDGHFDFRGGLVTTGSDLLADIGNSLGADSRVGLNRFGLSRNVQLIDRDGVAGRNAGGPVLSLQVDGVRVLNRCCSSNLHNCLPGFGLWLPGFQQSIL